jgi:hypothetical protein
MEFYIKPNTKPFFLFEIVFYIRAEIVWLILKI